MPQPQDVSIKHRRTAVFALRTRENKNRAIDRLMEDGLSQVDANVLITEVMGQNRQENRSFGIKCLAVGITGLVLAVVMVVFAQRIYFWLFGASLLAAGLGLIATMWPSPYKVWTTLSEAEP